MGFSVASSDACRAKAWPNTMNPPKPNVAAKIHKATADWCVLRRTKLASSGAETMVAFGSIPCTPSTMVSTSVRPPLSQVITAEQRKDREPYFVRKAGVPRTSRASPLVSSPGRRRA